MEAIQSSISFTFLTLSIGIVESSLSGLEWMIGIGRLSTLLKAAIAALIYNFIEKRGKKNTSKLGR